jgi:CxxC-x17-CxxC domain-containing protein
MGYGNFRGSSEGFGERRSSFGGERRSFGGGSRGFGGGRSGGFGGPRRSFGPREMTKIKCAECGKEDEVPFKPRDGTPVYCKDCYFKKKGIEPRTPMGNAPEGEKPKKEASEDSFGDESEESKEDEF